MGGLHKQTAVLQLHAALRVGTQNRSLLLRRYSRDRLRIQQQGLQGAVRQRRLGVRSQGDRAEEVQLVQPQDARELNRNTEDPRPPQRHQVLRRLQNALPLLHHHRVLRRRRPTHLSLQERKTPVISRSRSHERNTRRPQIPPQKEHPTPRFETRQYTEQSQKLENR